jgi:hypothetical protein
VNVYNKIKEMSIEELAGFMRNRFDSEMGSRSAGIGCSECTNYQTHHYPDDCIDEKCIWLNAENDYEKWLELESDVEQIEFSKED